MADVTIPNLPNKATPVITDLLEISANPGSFHITLGSLSAIYQPINQKGVANGYASLDAGALVPVSQLTTLNLIPAATGAVNINSQNLNNILNADVEGFIDIAEITTPANPTANIGRLYVKDVAAITTLFFRDFAGNDTNISTPAVTIDDLTDVTITTRAANEVLVVNGGNTLWVNALLVNANIDGAAAIAYSKLNLTGLVVNADLTSGVFAAITGIGVQSQALNMSTNFIDIAEISTPANPSVNVGRLYVKDNSTVTDLFFRDNAGVESQLTNLVLSSSLEDLTDTTITSAAAHESLVRNAGNTAWVNELIDNDNLAAGTFNNITGLPGVVTFETIDTPAVLTLTPNRSTPATGTIGDLIWSDNDTIPSTQEFARIRVVSSNITSGAEEGSMSIRVVEGGTVENYLTLNTAGFSGEILVLKPINMLDDAIIFTNDTSNPPLNSLKWIAHEFGVLWYNSDSQHDFAISGTSELSVKAGEFDFKDNQVKAARSYQFSGAASLPDSFLAYIQYINTPGEMLLNVQAAKTVNITVDAVDEYVFGSAQSDWNSNNMVNLGRTLMVNRFEYDKGADVASPAGGIMTLGDDGNVFDITGVNTINEILATNWQAGSIIHLQFDGILTVTNNSAGTNDILLGDGANMTTAVGDVLSLMFNGTDWQEVSRSSVSAGGAPTSIAELNTSITITDTGSDGLATFTMDGVTKMLMDVVGTQMNATRFSLAQATTDSNISSNVVTLNNEGNYFEFNNTVATLDGISSTGWQAGSIVYLRMRDANATGVTFAHNQTVTPPIEPLILIDGNNFTVTNADDEQIIPFMFDGSVWIQLARPIGGGTSFIGFTADANLVMEGFDITFNGTGSAPGTGTNVISVFDDAAQDRMMLSVATSAGSFQMRINAGLEYEFFNNTFNMNGNGITNPGNFLDSNNNEFLLWTTTASAVNYMRITNAATGNNPIFSVEGGDTDVGLTFQAKADGGFLFSNASAQEILQLVQNVTNSHDFVQITNSAGASTGPIIEVVGSNTDIDLNITTKGTGLINLNNDVLAAGDIVMTHRFQGAKGADVASGTTITLVDGNFFDVTGTTQIDAMTSTGWQAGSIVVLHFDAGLTITHNTGADGFFLFGAASYVVTADDTLTVIWNGSRWEEISRSVN